MDAPLALDVKAIRVLWGLNIEISMPALCMVVQIHLEIVSLETRLCGLTKLMKSFISAPLRDFVRLMYSVK